MLLYGKTMLGLEDSFDTKLHVATIAENVQDMKLVQIAQISLFIFCTLSAVVHIQTIMCCIKRVLTSGLR